MVLISDLILSDFTLRLISDASPHIVFVGLGCPKQEYWMKKASLLLPVQVDGCCRRESFDILAGDPPRAPHMDAEKRS